MDIRYADTFVKKFVGLLGTKTFPEYDGLFFPGTVCIHTFFMHYAIDILYLNKDYVVRKIARDVKPFHISWGTADSCSVVEMRSGAAKEKNIHIGDIINIEGKRDG